MASIYHKKYTRPMPEGAEVFARDGKKWARWTDGKGQDQTAPVTPDGKRLEFRTETWMARYHDGQGRRREVSTGCRDKASARQVLADLVKRAEQVKAGIITPQQSRTADHSSVPIAEHVAAYLEHLKAKTVRVSGSRRNTATTSDCSSSDWWSGVGTPGWRTSRATRWSNG